jgi:hypothetical protein
MTLLCAQAQGPFTLLACIEVQFYAFRLTILATMTFDREFPFSAVSPSPYPLQLHKIDVRLFRQVLFNCDYSQN